MISTNVRDESGASVADWWQQYQGFFLVALFPLIVILGALLRRRVRRYQNELMDNSAKGLVWGNSGNPVVDKIVAALSTVVHFSASVVQVSALLSATKLPFFWQQTGPNEWSMPIGKGSPIMGTIVRLEADGAGSRLALVRAPEILTIPGSDSDWRKFRRMSIKAAEAAGIESREDLGVLLVRTPQTDHTGLTPGEAAIALHYWEPPRG
jgi:hypothetical protein